MKNSTFVSQCANGFYTGEKHNGNIFFDGRHIYSYGHHYPLLVKIADKWIVNQSGYSSSTAKHISYARQYANFTMFTSSTDIATIYKNSLVQLDELYAKREALTARAFRKRESIQNDIDLLVCLVSFLAPLK